MVPWLRALFALADNQVSVASTLMVTHTPSVTPVQLGPVSSDRPEDQAHMLCTYTCRQNTHTPKIA